MPKYGFGFWNIGFGICLLFGIWSLVLPMAYAQVGTLPGIVDMVTSSTPLSSNIGVVQLSCAPTAGSGACLLASLFVYFVQRGRFLIASLAFLYIVVAGFRLVISQSEEALTTARRTILSVVVGTFLIFLSEPFIDSLYGGFSRAGGSALDPGMAAQGAIILSIEILGILRWIETIVAIVAVGLIIVEAVMVLGSFGTEETIRKAYRAVLYTIFGLLLVVFDRVIASIFGYVSLGDLPGRPSAAILIVEIFGFLRFILFFVGIILIGVVIYAGMLMLANFGSEDLITKSKTTLMNAGIGILLIIVSFVVISTVILGIT